MRQPDYYERGSRSFSGYFRKLIGVLAVSVLLGAAGVIASAIVGYSRFKPLQAIYLWQYLTSARRSSRSKTGISDYRLFVRVVTETDAKSQSADISKGTVKDRREAKNKVAPDLGKEQKFLCNDSQVSLVYVNGEQVRTPEGDLAIDLKPEIPHKSIGWQTITVNDLEIWSKFRTQIYNGESVVELMNPLRRYGMVVFAISLIVGFIAATKKHYRVNLTEEIREIQPRQVMGFVVTRVEVLKGLLMSSGSIPSSQPDASVLQVIESKSLSIGKAVPAHEETVVRRIKPVQQPLFATEDEQTGEDGESKFGLELFGAKDQGETEQ